MILLGKKLIAPYIEKMALAIMNFEGYYQGSRSQRNNNPGNIRWSSSNFPSWMKGATGIDETGHVIFNSFESGWNALISLLKMMFNNTSSIYNSGMTLYQVFQKYAEGNQKSYAESVARALGVSASSTLEEISHG